MTTLVNPFMSHPAAGGGAFSPSSLSPYGWFRAASLTGLSDGDGIASFTDLSGNGRHATQATSGKRPIYKTSIVNGKAVARFTAASAQRLLMPASTLVQPVTIYMCVLKSGGSYVSDGDGASTRLAFYGTSTMNIFAGANINTLLDPGTTNFRAWALHYDNASSRAKIDSAAVVTGTAGTQDPTSNLSIGGRFNDAEHATMDLAELVIVPGAWSTTAVNDMGDYFTAEYGTAWSDV